MILTLKLWYEAEWPRFLQKVSFWFFLWFLFVLILKTLKARAPATCGPFNFQNHSRRVLQLQITALSLGSRAGFWRNPQAAQAGGSCKPLKEYNRWR